MSKEKICTKCHKPFRSLRAGRDEDYVDFLKYFIERALEDGYTDREGYHAVKNWLYHFIKRFDEMKKKFHDFEEYLKNFKCF